MRPILAFAILLIGLRSAAPEARYHDPLPAIGNDSSPASFELTAPIGKSDPDFVVAIPRLESSDVAHDQGGDASELPQAPALSGSGPKADADAADSLDNLCHALMRSAQDNSLPVPFFANLIWQESHLQRDAVSPVGAKGIAQFMPEAAAEVGLHDPFDPLQAIPASARLLRTLREHFGNLGFAAAAYNAGARRVGDWLDHGHALPLETRNYVLRVTGHSIEAWRKAPLDDSELTFVPPLPCRDLPAFAELEQEQLHAAQQTEETHGVRLQQQKVADHSAATEPEPAANKPGKAEPVARRVAAKHAPASKAAVVAARSAHRSHEATHRPHAPREKRRVA